MNQILTKAIRLSKYLDNYSVPGIVNHSIVFLHTDKIAYLDGKIVGEEEAHFELLKALINCDGSYIDGEEQDGIQDFYHEAKYIANNLKDGEVLYIAYYGESGYVEAYKFNSDNEQDLDDLIQPYIDEE